MKWNQVLGGVFIGLGFGIFFGGAIVNWTGQWNSTSAAGGGMLLVITGMLAIRRDRLHKALERKGPEE